MDTTNLISLAALAIACAAFLIAIADWLQLGREAPWEATWGEEGILVLTRRHYWPVWIEGSSELSVGAPVVRGSWG